MVQILPEVPSFGTSLARNLGHGLSRGLNRAADFYEKMKLNKQKDVHGLSEKDLLESGVSPEDAKLFSKFTVGGQTQLAKDILESRKRGGSSTDAESQQQSSNENPQSESQDNEETPEQDIRGYLRDQDKGLTPSERIRRGAERYKTGLPVYQSAGDKLRSLSHTKRNLDILKDLSKSNKLPSGLGRLNVDEDGNLKLPFLASKEAQRFVKTVNEFASGAKDTYGSRVTNFDLAQYLKQFPNLLNSKEGINDLVEHINIINDINSVYYKNLKSVFDRSGGVRNIDTDVAESLAEKKSQKEIEKLTKKFAQIGTSEKLPAAHKNKGISFQDEETGEIFKSDGTSWIKQE